MPTRSACSVAYFAWAVGCGGAPSNGPSAVPNVAIARETRHAAVSSSRPAAMTAGSSDGMTCEQAREQYTEEITMDGSGGADLKADDFAAVLNNGSYLNPCDVPQTSKVRICAAVQNGHAVGVTVQLDPSSTEMEICVAGQVRQLSFPGHPKMDFVNVTF